MALLRARYWYEQARNGLEDGLSRTLVETRLGEVAKAGKGL